METLMRDVAVTLRGWRRQPAFPLAVALTLGLGIGANVAMFGVADAVLLRPLPYALPERLVVVWTELPRRDQFAARSSGPELAALWEKARAFESVGGVWARPGVLRSGDGPVEEIEVGWITPGFLEALGVRPHLGRLPTPEELAAESSDVMVLSYGLWQGRYGGDPAIVGRTIDFDDERKTVIGVMPRGFRMLFPPDHGVPESVGAWLPWGGSANAYREMSRGFRVFSAVARLAPEVSLERALAEARTLARSIEAESTEYAASGFGLRLAPLGASVAAHARPALVMLMGVSAVVLLIACANVANLSLVRAAARARELSVRAALGAKRSRLLRQLLTESGFAGALGAATGLALTAWGLPLLVALEPGRLPRMQEAGLDARVLAYAAAASVLTALLFGGASARLALHGAGAGALHDGARGSSPRRRLLGPLLVVGQLGLSCVLLAGAGLLLRSFAALLAVDPGFDANGVVTLRLSLPDVHYSYREQGPKIAAFYRRLDERLAALPGVRAAGSTMAPPLSGIPAWTRPYAVREGAEGEAGGALADYTTVTPGWFRAAGVRLVAGRFLEDRHDREHPLAVVIDTTLARKAWQRADPIGKAIRVEVFRDGRFQPLWGEVVGMVEPVRWTRLEAIDREHVYLAHAQAPQRTMHATLRVAGNPLALLPAVQAEVDALEKDLPAFDVRLATEHVASASALNRFALAGLMAFALVATALAAAGVYSLMASLVQGRRREMGVRLALGAEPRRVLSLVVRQGMGYVAIGAALGLVGSFAGARVLSGLLFGVTAGDPATLAGVIALLAATGLAACLFPALAAARVEPSEALRSE